MPPEAVNVTTSPDTAVIVVGLICRVGSTVIVAETESAGELESVTVRVSVVLPVGPAVNTHVALPWQLATKVPPEGAVRVQV